MVLTIASEHSVVALALHKQGIVLHDRLEVGFQVSSFKAGTNAPAFFLCLTETHINVSQITQITQIMLALRQAAGARRG